MSDFDRLFATFMSDFYRQIAIFMSDFAFAWDGKGCQYELRKLFRSRFGRSMRQCRKRHS